MPQSTSPTRNKKVNPPASEPTAPIPASATTVIARPWSTPGRPWSAARRPATVSFVRTPAGTPTTMPTTARKPPMKRPHGSLIPSAGSGGGALAATANSTTPQPTATTPAATPNAWTTSRTVDHGRPGVLHGLAITVVALAGIGAVGSLAGGFTFLFLVGLVLCGIYALPGVLILRATRATSRARADSNARTSQSAPHA